MLQLPNLYLNARENVEDFNAMLIFLILLVFINLGTFKCENQLKLVDLLFTEQVEAFPPFTKIKKNSQKC